MHVRNSKRNAFKSWKFIAKCIYISFSIQHSWSLEFKGIKQMISSPSVYHYRTVKHKHEQDPELEQLNVSFDCCKPIGAGATATKQIISVFIAFFIKIKWREC